jgi:hypothetical protein
MRPYVRRKWSAAGCHAAWLKVIEAAFAKVKAPAMAISYTPLNNQQ